MVIIKYIPKGFTNSGNEYVTIDNEDMQILMQRLILLLAKYSEATSSDKAKTILEKNKEMFGQRKGGQHNTRLSLLGGIVYNYFNKESGFRNDISRSQLPYIENVVNEYAEIYDEETIRFVVDLF